MNKAILWNRSRYYAKGSYDEERLQNGEVRDCGEEEGVGRCLAVRYMSYVCVSLSCLVEVI